MSGNILRALSTVSGFSEFVVRESSNMNIDHPTLITKLTYQHSSLLHVGDSDSSVKAFVSGNTSSPKKKKENRGKKT